MGRSGRFGLGACRITGSLPNHWEPAESRDGPLLVAAAVAVPDLELGAVGGVERRIVEAPAGDRVDEHAVHRQPLLAAGAAAGPQLDQGAVTGPAADDIQALAHDADGAVE